MTQTTRATTTESTRDTATSQRSRSAKEFRTSWRVLVAALLGLLLCYIPIATISVVIIPWSRTFGWTFSLISAYAVFQGTGSALAAPFTGRLIDRFGARTIALIFVPVWGITVASAGLLTEHIWTLYFMMLIWGCLIPGTGAYFRVVNGWFDAGRGTALGIVYAGIGFGCAIGPPLAQWFVDHSTWRAGYLFLGAIVILAWPLAFFWLHEKRDLREARHLQPEAETGFSRKEALTKATFYCISGATAFSSLTTGGKIFLVPFLSDNGMSRAMAAACVGLGASAFTVALPLFGVLIDRTSAPLVATAAFLLDATAFTILAFTHNKYALPVTIMDGIASGAWMSCSGYCVARYFGLKAFGAISGLIGSIGGGAAMLAPLIFSLLHDKTGSYTVSYVVVGSFAFGGAICAAILTRFPFPNWTEVSGADGKPLS